MILGTDLDDLNWPKLVSDDWQDTREGLHRWLQVVGKIQMASSSLLNHWWNIGFRVSALGLRTSLMYSGSIYFDIEFDLSNHLLVIRSYQSDVKTIELRSMSVADFYTEVFRALKDLGIEPNISTRPNEVDPAIDFSKDTEVREYDKDSVSKYWHQCLGISQVLEYWRAGFAGKSSPVQLFWGSMDLSQIRYSGRAALVSSKSTIPNLPVWVLQEAEFRENFSVGFWSGGSTEGSFYSYGSPAPDGITDYRLDVGYFDKSIGEWILPYELVRASNNPQSMILDFFSQTYNIVANLANWDRSMLDIDPERLSTKYHI